MTAYFVMISVPAMVAIISGILRGYKIKNVDRIIVDSFFSIWLVLLMFRSSRLGIDLPVYNYHFKNYSQYSLREILKGIVNKEFEAFYVLICKIVSVFTDNFHVVIMICALISVIPIWKMYRKDVRHGYLMVILFVNIAPFTMYFSGLRQAIAMAFVAPCFYYCKEKKLFYFLAMVMLAYLAHNSAFILIIMYPVYHIKLKKKIHLLYVIPGIILIRQLRLSVFTNILRFMSEDYYEQYEGGIQSTGAYAVWLLLIIFLLYSFIIVDDEKLDDEIMGLRNLLIISVVLQIFAGVHTLAMRMNYYYLLFVPIVMARIIDKGKNRYTLIIKVSLVCMVCFFTYYFFKDMHFGSDDLQIYPYISMFAQH